jgi:SAM-dependent methyltransferase
MPDYRFHTDDIPWNLVRCRRCRLGYLNPRPTREEVGRYYPEPYYAVRAGHRERYERLADYVTDRPGRLLDLGTARGDFLDVMADRGWQVQGIEPFAEPRTRHPVARQAFPEECDLPADTFDVITAWAVFEHLYDPASAFRECARMLKPGGRLVIQVPNLRSIYARQARQEDIPRHLHFYEPRTLRAYGDRHGLRLARVHHTTHLFGGSGRGVLRRYYTRALGKSESEFIDRWQAPQRERWQRWPLFTLGWSAAAAVEGVVLADPVVRAARISGQIVAEFEAAD